MPRPVARRLSIVVGDRRRPTVRGVRRPSLPAFPDRPALPAGLSAVPARPLGGGNAIAPFWPGPPTRPTADHPTLADRGAGGQAGSGRVRGRRRGASTDRASGVLDAERQLLRPSPRDR